MLRAVQRLLRQNDYEPILFSSAEELEQHADIDKALCIILDINLNRRSGIDLRHQLKAECITVPVIFITGNASPSVREAPRRSGSVGFQSKPFSVDDLIEPLKRATASRTS